MKTVGIFTRSIVICYSLFVKFIIFRENIEDEVDNVFDELYEDLYIVMKCRKGVVNFVL